MAGESDSFEIKRELARCVPTLLSCEAALPRHADLQQEHEFIAAAEERGHFHPDEEEVVMLRYSQYMAIRSSLVQVLEQLEGKVYKTHITYRYLFDRTKEFKRAKKI